MAQNKTTEGRTSVRGWHTWLSVVLALPIAIVSLTAIFIAHDKAMGLKEIYLPSALSVRTGEPMLPDVRSVQRDGQGVEFIATKYGLLRRDGAALTPVAELKTMEVRDLAAVDGRLVAATKGGVWMQQDGAWRQVLPGEAWSVNALADGRLGVAIKEQGLYVSADRGGTWTREAALDHALRQHASAMPTPPMTVAKLVMDLHTGKIFFGKEYEWIWIDLIGATMVFLTFSGLILWLRAQRQKAKLALAQHRPAGHMAPAE